MSTNGSHIETGITGLDKILSGGLTPNRLYLVEGDPGSGKTTLALQFLLAGIRRGESCMFVTLSESKEELYASAESHGWNLDGINVLEIIASEDGSMRRRLQVCKLRGRSFSEGFHDYVIRRGGIELFPRLIAAAHRTPYDHQDIKSGLDSLDLLLGGGLAKGTSTLIMGAAGTGKSSLATQYARVIAASGQHASIFLFDEAITTFKQRSANLGIDVENLINEGMLNVQQVDPAELAPGEFAHAVRQAVDQQHTQLVVIDSLNGYLNAMPSDRFLTLHMHELLTYLNQLGVTTLLLMAQNGLIGTDTRSPIDASYIADTVMLLRYFEAFGEVRQAISVIKKRTGRHERSIRELKLDHGIVVGPPLRDFHGILQGAPQFISHGLERDLEHKQY